jgi:hypothetical protein
MSGFDYFIKNDFDLVFKTNLSTIINFEKFYEYCEQIPETGNLFMMELSVIIKDICFVPEPECY